VPRLIGYVGEIQSNEMLLITTLACCFAVSLLAVKLGYSPALGAFVIGAIIAEAREIHRIEALIRACARHVQRDLFVTIGLLLDPRVLLDHWLPILAITIAVVLGKVSRAHSVLSSVEMIGALHCALHGTRANRRVLIHHRVARLSLNVTSKFLYPIAVAVSVITTLLTPT